MRCWPGSRPRRYNPWATEVVVRPVAKPAAPAVRVGSSGGRSSPPPPDRAATQGVPATLATQYSQSTAEGPGRGLRPAGRGRSRHNGNYHRQTRSSGGVRGARTKGPSVTAEVCEVVGWCGVGERSCGALGGARAKGTVFTVGRHHQPETRPARKELLLGRSPGGRFPALRGGYVTAMMASAVTAARVSSSGSVTQRGGIQ